MAAIEDAGVGDAEARAGERVARTDPVTAVLLTTMTWLVMVLVSRLLRRWLQRGRAP